MRPLAEASSDWDNNLAEPCPSVSHQDTATGGDLDLGNGSWIPTRWGASVMLHGTDAAPLALGDGLILILTTIGNAIFYCCASLFFLEIA
jgi:hypothetical protein